ncbi:hypothetical protein PHMEG_00031011 [Phytophthora megakarya]|uniref:Uncharacterized protein n=1 Tax=Phytophthora megakarya TaxID=4795 RepID=A0A225V1D3_9STRA|nr:hypothetical protein PHMEG_00031011 [Phytophthora megakarya]
MVRLSSRSYLHLLPEQAGECFDHPFYAQVLQVGQDEVMFKDRQVHYGQVIEVAGTAVTVATAGEQISTTTEHISPVSPIVALLLEHVKFPCDDWSSDEIEGIQVAIVDRVLGRNVKPHQRTSLTFWRGQSAKTATL